MENPFEELNNRLTSIESKLENLIHKLDHPAESIPVWMSSKQVAEYLNISTTAVSNLRINKLPYYKVGGRIMFKKAEIDEYIERSRHKSGSEYLNEYLSNKR